MVLEFDNAMVKIFYFIFPNAMQMHKSKYAKVKVNMDNYRFLPPGEGSEF
jgi:hypothetical protein